MKTLPKTPHSHLPLPNFLFLLLLLQSAPSPNHPPLKDCQVVSGQRTRSRHRLDDRLYKSLVAYVLSPKPRLNASDTFPSAQSMFLQEQNVLLAWPG